MESDSALILLGPFKEIVTGDKWPDRGPVSMESVHLIRNGGILVEDKWIFAVGDYDDLRKQFPGVRRDHQEKDLILFAGFIDSHTHCCWAGSRSADFSRRLEGKHYQEIAAEGGGIWSTVRATREASFDSLLETTLQRLGLLLARGITTVEIKSGYGLNVPSEIKILRVIEEAKKRTILDVVPTCLAAHIKPKDFSGSNINYLDMLLKELLPVLKKEMLTERIDIFIDREVFTPEESTAFLKESKQIGFAICVHADQFSPGGSKVGCDVDALSVDHLECSRDRDLEMIARSDTIGVVLPGASLGLGMSFAPARKLLDLGGKMAIASDWNPGSAPMGNLLTQASILATYEKLNVAEVIASVTFRAAKVLNLHDRGRLTPGQLADMQAYEIEDYRDLIYYQGEVKPTFVWKNGKKEYEKNGTSEIS